MPDDARFLPQYDSYIETLFAGEDAALREIRERALVAGLPEINVSPSEGRLLELLARAVGARRVLEIGTLGGYSAAWLARALPADGKLVSLEIDAHHAEVARESLRRAGLSALVEVRLGPAAESLARMGADEPFDLVFIDADKDGYEGYLKQVLPLVRPGGLILADNALGAKHVASGAKTGIARYNAAVAGNPGLCSMMIPVFRGEGSVDGLLVSVKTG
ncbi:MAG TPA: O-methyltransferase [Planctomycetota bacterium]|nr:O-methyltransferase [Planctomycetota bacterium]